MINKKIICLLLILIYSTTHIQASAKDESKKSTSPKKTEQEKFDEDLDRVGVRSRTNLVAPSVAAHALIQACSPTINLNNSKAVIQYILAENPVAVNHAGYSGETPLHTIVHGVFNAPVDHVNTLLAAKANPSIP